MKRFFLLLFVVILSAGAGWYIWQKAYPTYVLKQYKKDFVVPYAQQIVDDLNTDPRVNGRQFKLYTAMFYKDDTIPVLKEKDENSILWLGGYDIFLNSNLSKFGLILTTSPRQFFALRYFMKLPAYYVPISLGQQQLSVPTAEATFAVIGNPPFIKDILKQRGITYQSFSLSQSYTAVADFSAYKAVFIEDPYVYYKTIDLPPMVISAASANIPLVSSNIRLARSPLNIFNDNAIFYVREDDANALITRLLSQDNLIEWRKNEVSNFMTEFFSKQQTIDRLKQIVFEHTDPTSDIKKNSLNVVIPTNVGGYRHGDYWVGSDLRYAMMNKYGKNTQLVFVDSAYDPPAETVISLGGYLVINQKKLGDVNLFYLIYPDKRDTVDDKYINSIIQLFDYIDVFVSSSPDLVEKVKEKGYDAVYLPQFTNPERFYFDYDKELETDVLFVANYHFNRTIPLNIYKRGLPITIYGQFWPDNVAKKLYIDNQILRRYYSSAKIVLNETQENMRKTNVISNRIFDATASGALVISDYVPEIEKVYGDSVPTYKTEEELVELINYYLEHSDERKEKARRAQAITLQHFTLDKVTQTLHQLILDVKKKKGIVD